jgi:hypothetical protein
MTTLNFVPRSDIDIIAVTAAPVTKPQAKNILQAINFLDGRCPLSRTGSLEPTIVKEPK